MEPVMLRRFEPRDAEAVSALIGTTMRRSNSRDYPAEVLRPLIDYFAPAKLIQLAGERHCLVAEEGGRVIGTAARDGAELVTFFVHADAQGRGVGTRLLGALEDEARAAGVARLTVEASVTGAPFYEQRGYRRTGRTVDGTAGVQIAMEKVILDGGPAAPAGAVGRPGSGGAA
jgi:putative acetyltransferase